MAIHYPLSSSRNSSPRNSPDSFKGQAYYYWMLLMVLAGGYGLGHWHGRRYNSAVVWMSTGSSSSEHCHNVATAFLPQQQQPQVSLSLPHGRPAAQKNNDGWRSVDVFYGKADFFQEQQQQLNLASTTTTTTFHNTDTTTTSPTIQWFSQAAQDELVVGLLRGKRNGYFVDLAANDATLLSNTYALEQYYGWTGLCIEPNPLYWKNLTYYRSCQTVGAVVGDTQQRHEPVWFRYEAGDHGGIAGEGFDNGKRWQQPRHSQIAYTVPLLEIFQRYQAPLVIDYLSLDLEGAESFVLMNFPLAQYQIHIITAERLHGAIRQYLKRHGYICVQKLTRWGESLWVHTSIQQELDWSVMERLGFPRG